MFLRIVALMTLILPTAVPAAEPAKPPPLKVFILAGQSNMEGKAKMSLVEYQAAQPATAALFAHHRKDGAWIERDDVWIKFLDRKGKLTVGFGSPKCVGPELEFGYVVGERYTEPVLLIKTAWGGRSLYRDFRPPSAGLPPTEALEKMLADQKKRKPETTMDEVKASFGATYRDMLKEISGTLGDLKTHFPQYDGRGYELAGFLWFQGWNDLISDPAVAEYASNMAHFIRDVRKDLGAPKLPFVIAQLGVDGVEGRKDAKKQKFKDAQAAPAALEEFKGNVAVVKTDELWDTEADAVYRKGWKQNVEQWNTVGSDYPYHYLGSAKTYGRIGKAMAEAVLELRGETVKK